MIWNIFKRNVSVPTFDGEPLTNPVKLNDKVWNFPLMYETEQIINIDLFRIVKRELKYKALGIGYRSNRKIAEILKISPTTVHLMSKAKSFKEYKKLRNQHSSTRRSA